MSPRSSRRAGLLIPLFSAPSRSSWGIGEIPDLYSLTTWLNAAGQRALQLLPLNEMAPGQQSPYSAISAMAIDPIYLRLQDVPDWSVLGGDEALGNEDRKSLEHVRRAAHVEYTTIRRLKESALLQAFDRFYEHEWRCDSSRAADLRAFVATEHWWLDDYALFRAIRRREHGRPWTEWPESLRRHVPEALEYVRMGFEREIVFHQYLQWIADAQWRIARMAARASDVALLGDLPFMVDADSADVWSHQRCFHLDISVGAPPDAFSATGQNWGMPLYNWGAMEDDNFQWLRKRARRSADLFDGYRVDHLVGFYRTYGWPQIEGQPAFFTPSEQPDQVRLGERVLTIFKEPGAEIIAEDLGIVPDFVRASMAGLGVPGFKILRWERRWHEEGQPFRDPDGDPAASVAASGTHDTESMMAWWAGAGEDDRRQLNSLPAVQRLTQGAGLLDLRDEAHVRDVLLEVLFASGSDLVLLPVQDIFGWHDRINVPGTVTPDNWTFRLPWPIDTMNDVPEAQECQARLSAWVREHSRVS